MDSAIGRSTEPEASMWGLTEQLLALVGDYMATSVWMNSVDGEKGRNRPKPIPRPGIEPDETEERTFGSDPLPIDELEEFLNWSKSEIKRRRNQPRDPVTGRFVKRQ